MNSTLAPVNSGLESMPESRTAEESGVIIHRSPRALTHVWRVPAADADAVDRAVATAQKTFQSWRRKPVQERLKTLQNFGSGLQEKAERLAQLLVEDVGKPIQYARGEVARAIALTEAAAAQICQTDHVPIATGYRREPHGVIGLIAPFNNPLAIPVGKIVPALLYGNVVVWKPAVAGSRIALETAEIFAKSGDANLVQVVFGGEEAGREVMRKCDAITISGSLDAGEVAKQICVSRNVPLQAELGGNNASIVWGDADLNAASESIAEGAFAFAGQRCTANRRAIVSAAIYDDFIEQIVNACRQLMLGDPVDEKTQIGPLISTAARDRVEAAINRAIIADCRVVRPLALSQDLREGAWLQPAIVCCDDPTAEIVQEETFGPVLVIQRAETWDEAIELCNGVRHGLAAALFSREPRRIDDFLDRVKAGILKINSSTADAAVDLPFGGWKASGFGPPEHGPANREFFTRLQSIYFLSSC